MFRRLLLLVIVIALLRYRPDLAINSAKVLAEMIAQLILRCVSGEEIPVDQRFKPNPFLHLYAQQLAECGKAGPRVKAITEKLKGTPTDRLIDTYGQLRTRWTYRNDENSDMLQSAEASAGPLKFEGDCEDFAAMMMAALSTIDGLTSRIVLCTGKTDKDSGHAFCEVLIASDLRKAAPTLQRLRTAWNLPALACHRGPSGVWVPLDFIPPGSIHDGPVYCFIAEDGEVTFPVP